MSHLARLLALAVTLAATTLVVTGCTSDDKKICKRNVDDVACKSGCTDDARDKAMTDCAKTLEEVKRDNPKLYECRKKCALAPDPYTPCLFACLDVSTGGATKPAPPAVKPPAKH